MPAAECAGPALTEEKYKPDPNIMQCGNADGRATAGANFGEGLASGAAAFPEVLFRAIGRPLSEDVS